MKRAIFTAMMLAFCGAAFAQEAPDQPNGGGGPAVNASVFYSDHIRAVTAVTEVFGRGQKTTAAIVEYNQPIKDSSLDRESFAVSGRSITNVYANDQAAKAATGRDGRFVVIELDPADEGAFTYTSQVDEAATTLVTQSSTVESASGEELQPTGTPVINTRQKNLIVDDFRLLRFTDPETGLSLAYNLYVPKEYDPGEKYPLVLFMHDAGVTGTNPLRTLEQGLGAVSFASPGDQARHPSFVLAPQYPVALANDESQTSVYADITVRLIEELASTYSIDANRLYTTGQSGGCMTSIALNIKYPDLFAASFLVAGQWDPTVVAPLADKKLWVIVSQDDNKAYPGMNAIMETLEANGAEITRDVWNGRADEAEFRDDVAAMLEAGPDSNVYYVSFEKGSVFPEGEAAGGGGGHTGTWPIAYAIDGVRDWLFRQSK